MDYYSKQTYHVSFSNPSITKYTIILKTKFFHQIHTQSAIKRCVLSGSVSPLPPPLATCLAAMSPHDGLAGSSCGVSSHLEITGEGRIYLLPHQDHPLQSPRAPRRDSNDGPWPPLKRPSSLEQLHAAARAVCYDAAHLRLLYPTQ